MLSALDIDRAPNAATSARCKTNLVADLIDALPNPIDPTKTKRLIDRFQQPLAKLRLGHIVRSAAVQSLDAPYRSVFVLRDIEELSTEETAEALGLSVPAVKSRLLRARLQLREKLTRQFKRKGDDAFAYL